ncbi:hypothetical protein M436DRAFT_80299 [Aureobasidium namibiae CBS 147.97]|uniref:Uncharacterized protein n=1 Tax=Aureobasidium namibiae CBS 147.97 TaxID=1043004 RepID=A0A074WNW6_9PEZI
MPDKTHFDLETLLLLVIAMLNPMIAVFMMKGCGKEFVICTLLFILCLFPAWLYTYWLIADRHKRKKSGVLIVVGVTGQSSGSNVVQLQRANTAPPPVVQTIEYKPQPALPAPTPASAPPPTPASPTKATEVVMVTKAPDSPPAAAPAPVVVPAPGPR